MPDILGLYQKVPEVKDIVTTITVEETQQAHF